MFQSEDKAFNQVKEFHLLMDGETQETVKVFSPDVAGFRAGFKIEEIVEFLYAASGDESTFDEQIKEMHKALDLAVTKVKAKKVPDNQLVGQVDALLDLLYFTYGSFALMGVDPKPLFDIVHRANMGKQFPDGKAHFDPRTHKILKPEHWERDFAPEYRIAVELLRQQNR